MLSMRTDSEAKMYNLFLHRYIWHRINSSPLFDPQEADILEERNA